MKIYVSAIGLTILLLCASVHGAETKIPIIHSTDLFHPHVDPDDHFDLATLFALTQFDIKGIVLDNHGSDQVARGGKPAVEQMMYITGRKTPYAIGLKSKLRDRNDKALEDDDSFQSGVKLMLSVLRNSHEKVVINLVGSATDMAAAFNREPELIKSKVKAIYLQAGDGLDGPQTEYNVGLAPVAYARLLDSGLPLYWCPCYGKNGYLTRYDIKEMSTFIGACTKPVQNFFVYCFNASKDEPIGFLAGEPHPLPKGGRPMWCTAPMFHAAGRLIYQRGADDFVALTPDDAKKARLADKAVNVYEFLPVRLDSSKFPNIRAELNPSHTNTFVFRVTDSRYGAIIDSCLKNLLAELGQKK